MLLVFHTLRIYMYDKVSRYPLPFPGCVAFCLTENPPGGSGDDASRIVGLTSLWSEASLDECLSLCVLENKNQNKQETKNDCEFRSCSKLLLCTVVSRQSAFVKYTSPLPTRDWLCSNVFSSLQRNFEDLVSGLILCC